MKQLMDLNDYDSYLKKQWKEVERVYELKLFSKHIDMIENFLKNYEGSKAVKDFSVLCIGARYGIEILAFEQMGFNPEKIIAIDIYPRNERIIKADMHQLPFNDSSFDIIYSHHSIDHSLFPHQAFDEFSRVSKKNSYWIFTIPFSDYGKEEAIDFDSGEEIVEVLTQYRNVKGPIYFLEVKRNSKGYVEPKETWLPIGWKNEIRIIL